MAKHSVLAEAVERVDAGVMTPAARLVRGAGRDVTVKKSLEKSLG